MTAHVEAPEVKSGAAGAKISRLRQPQYRYFDPKGSGRPITRT